MKPNYIINCGVAFMIPEGKKGRMMDWACNKRWASINSGLLSDRTFFLLLSAQDKLDLNRKGTRFPALAFNHFFLFLIAVSLAICRPLSNSYLLSLSVEQFLSCSVLVTSWTCCNTRQSTTHAAARIHIQSLEILHNRRLSIHLFTLIHLLFIQHQQQGIHLTTSPQ